MYIYSETQAYDISQIPTKFSQELKRNADWLKFGFHSVKPIFSETEISRLDSFKIAYTKVENAITDFADKKSLSTCLRLHYFFATDSEKVYLKEKGIKVLLTADNPGRLSYSLPFYVRGTYSDTCMHYLQTDMRVENMSIFPYYDLSKYCEEDTFVIFTHEWALNSRKMRFKFERSIKHLSRSNVVFIN